MPLHLYIIACDFLKEILADIWARHIEGCEWMGKLPFARHPHSESMAKKSKVTTMPIMQLNEAKHEDCLKIMDNYEKTLTQLFIEANGNKAEIMNIDFLSVHLRLFVVLYWVYVPFNTFQVISGQYLLVTGYDNHFIVLFH